MSREVLTEVLAVLDEVARLDELRGEHTRKWADLAKRARAGEGREALERDRTALQLVVVDYGDVWNDLRALRPKVARALKGKG